MVLYSSGGNVMDARGCTPPLPVLPRSTLLFLMSFDGLHHDTPPWCRRQMRYINVQNVLSDPR